LPISRRSAAIATLGVSLVIAVLLFGKMAPDDRPWTFALSPVPAQAVAGPPETAAEVLTPPGERMFVHGAAAIDIPGGIAAFWYRAVYEGANNAELVSEHFDGTKWSGASVVTNSARVSSDIGIRIKSLANPVPFRRSDNEIWLFFSVSRLSGWATCEIAFVRSFDNGKTWGPAQRLYASPFLNISHLTKSTPILFSDGRIGLPVYQEMIQKFPVLLVLDGDGRVIDKRRMGNGGKVGFQPMIVPTSASTAIAFVRRLKRGKNNNVLLTRTDDGGRTWSRVAPIDLPNPGAPITAVRYDSNRILMAFNDDPKYESNITVAFSDLEGKTFQRIGLLAREDNPGRKFRVAYPFLINSAPGQFDLMYSRPLKTINHVRFSSAWIERSLQSPQAQK
jgi:predicted neuraminidase